MKKLLAVLSAFFIGTFHVDAQETPGVLSGTIGGQPIEIPLDCSLWSSDQSQVYAAGDNRSGRDRNGDSFAISYSFLRDAEVLTGMFVTIDQTRYNLGPVFGSDDATGGWVIDENSARLAGRADNFGNPVSVELVLDCAKRSAAERGFTGLVAGTFDGQEVESSLSCRNWKQGSFIAADTDDGVVPRVELTVFPNGVQGTVQVKTAEKTYQWVVAPIAGTKFKSTPDTVIFAADLNESNTGREYSVELAFFCPIDE